MPRTRLGKWSVALIVIFFLLFATFQLLVASGQRGGDTFLSNLLLAVPMLVAGICGVFAFFTGVTSIIKSQERSVFVFLATAMGLFILIFLFGEILAPH